jgi:ornithine cyclodeaminase/alanine dehydrogenase-like protein (mu-crystallin family)
MSTLLLTRSEIEGLLDIPALLPVLKEGFVQYSQRALLKTPPAQCGPSSLPKEDSSATLLYPGLLSGIPAYSVKVHAKFPSHRFSEQGPAIRGLIHLFDIDTGELLALLESGYITAVCTGLASALAAHTLARQDAKTVAVIGAGAQGRWQLRALARLRFVKQVLVFDNSPFVAGKFVAEMARELEAKIVSVNTLAEALIDADIILSATWSRLPFLHFGLVNEGVHISTLGADEPGKAEISAELLEQSLVVCDDRDLASSQGALGNVGLTINDIHAEFGEVLTGHKHGRQNDDDITVFASVGLAWQDLAAVWQVYVKAKEMGLGRGLEFLA